MAAETAQLGLVTPTQGDLTGTWGNVVNNGITEYVNIAIAATLTLTGDGAVTLANTTGNASVTNITSSLAGAGTVTAQFAAIRVTGTTTTKVITGPSYSKTYVVDNASSYTVTFKAAGETGVSIVAGEKAVVFFNSAVSNADYVKVASSTADGVTTIDFGTTGLTPATATSGAVTVAGTLAPANGGTGVSNNAAMTVTGSGNFAYTRTLTGTTNVTLPTTGTLSTLAGSETFTNKTLTNPTVTNYVESVVAIGTVTSSNTLSLTSGTVQTVTLTASTACTFTMPTATAGKSFILIVTQASGGSGTAVFTSVKFPGGTAPTITATASAIDILTFVANGTSWFGTYAQAFA
jgi:hypothetical protein